MILDTFHNNPKILHMKVFFTIVLLVLTHTSINAQPVEQWVARYNSPGSVNDTVIDMEIDDIGNVYILGYNSGFITLKYNANGNEEWVRTYKGPSQFQDKASDMVVDDSGNVYVTGTSITNNQSPYHAAAVVIKYSSKGDTLWTLRFENADSIGCNGRYILQADSSNVYLTAECVRTGQSEDITALKISPVGEILWEEYFSGIASHDDDITFSTVDNLKRLYISGKIQSTDIWTVLRFTGNGQKNLEINDTVSINKVLVDNNFSILSGGGSFTPQSAIDINISKYDTTGNKIWSSSYHHNSFLNYDTYKDFTIDKYGNSFVTGNSSEGMEINWDIVTIKYNPNGDSMWVQRYDSIYNSLDDPNSIAVDNKGNVYVTGYTNFNLLANWFITISYDSIGNQRFVLYYNNGLPFHNYEAKFVKTDNEGNFYVTGVSHNANADYDIATIKYSVLSNIQAISNEMPNTTKLYQNFPNPFNSESVIKFDITLRQQIEVEVFDILGRSLFLYEYGNLSPGSYQFNFKTNNIASGIYYYALKSNNEVLAIKKMSLIK